MKDLSVVLYDGDCALCCHWVEKLRSATCGRLIFKPYQATLGEFPQILEKQCQDAIQLVMVNGKVFSGAHAVIKALSLSGRNNFLLYVYEYSPFMAGMFERVYRFIAANRFRSSLSNNAVIKQRP
ncbi:MAG: DUF393 domain-containing protein [Candidatus Omnitrophica bacterium]|nr:DUF393 domain-containing protein [Candidatus Omnitrophota bacterium]